MQSWLQNADLYLLWRNSGPLTHMGNERVFGTAAAALLNHNALRRPHEAREKGWLPADRPEAGLKPATTIRNYGRTLLQKMPVKFSPRS